MGTFAQNQQTREVCPDKEARTDEPALRIDIQPRALTQRLAQQRSSSRIRRSCSQATSSGGPTMTSTGSIRKTASRSTGCTTRRSTESSSPSMNRCASSSGGSCASRCRQKNSLGAFSPTKDERCRLGSSMNSTRRFSTGTARPSPPRTDSRKLVLRRPPLDELLRRVPIPQGALDGLRLATSVAPRDPVALKHQPRDVGEIGGESGR